MSSCPSFWSGQRGSNSLPAIPRMAVAIRRSPGSPRIGSRLRRGVEAASSAGLLCHSKKKGHDLSSCPSFWSGQRGSNSLPAIPRMARRHSQDPWLTSDWIAPPARGGGSEFGGASLSFQKERTRLVVVSFFLERATRLELASRHPANGSPLFAGPLAHLGLDRASGAGWRQRVR